LIKKKVLHMEQLFLLIVFCMLGQLKTISYK